MEKNTSSIKKIGNKFGKADLHIHSNYSDGRPTIEEILDYVEKNTDLDVIAITDHDEIEGALKAEELVEKGNYRFEVIVGEEVSSNEGHIVGLFLKKKIEHHQPAHEVLKQIKEQGGISIAAHPFENMRFMDSNGLTMDGIGLVNLIKEKNGFDAIEIVNATPTLGEENTRAKFVNRTLLFKTETGSSDAHIVEAIGKGYTIFEGNTKAGLRNALMHHQTQAMRAKWNFRALFKYAFFFIPIGIRMTFFTLLHGRGEKKPQIVNFE